jgi:hypothetical protein
VSADLDVLIPLSPLVCVVALFGLVAHGIRRLREGGRPRLASPTPLALGSVLSLSAALMVFAYAEATYATSFFPEDVCSLGAGIRELPEKQTRFPLSTVCGGVELVPAWVNPVILGLIALGVATLAAVPLAVWVRAGGSGPRGSAPPGPSSVVGGV